MRAVAAVCLLAGVAHAGNEDSFLYGGQAALTGGAVVATTDDSAAVWYNPAGLASNHRSRVELSGTAFTLRVRPIPSGLVLDLPTQTFDIGIDSYRPYVVPAGLALARNVSDRWSVGAGLFVTEQDLFNYKADVLPSDDTVELEVAGALTGTLIRYHAGIAIGYAVSPHVRLGASVFGVYEDYREFRKLFANAVTTGTYSSVFLQRLVDARATRFGVEALAGAQIEVGDGWTIGLTARSPRLIVREYAETDNSTVLVSKSETAPEIAETQVDHQPLGAEGTGFTHPPRFVAALAHRFDTVDAAAEVDWRPSGVGVLAQRAVWNARIGATWIATDNTTLGAGLFTDRSGAGTPTSFPDFRVDYYGLTAGLRHSNTVHLQAGEDARTLRFSTTVAIRYALGVGQSTNIEFDFRDAPQTGLVGRTDDRLVDVRYHELSLYVASGLDF